MFGQYSKLKQGKKIYGPLKEPKQLFNEFFIKKSIISFKSIEICIDILL